MVKIVFTWDSGTLILCPWYMAMAGGRLTVLQLINFQIYYKYLLVFSSDYVVRSNLHKNLRLSFGGLH